jgi:hypothetical protein
MLSLEKVSSRAARAMVEGAYLRDSRSAKKCPMRTSAAERI